MIEHTSASHGSPSKRAIMAGHLDRTEMAIREQRLRFHEARSRRDDRAATRAWCKCGALEEQRDFARRSLDKL